MVVATADEMFLTVEWGIYQS